jgi:hypothetical protein
MTDTETPAEARARLLKMLEVAESDVATAQTDYDAASAKTNSAWRNSQSKHSSLESAKERRDRILGELEAALPKRDKVPDGMAEVPR